MSLEFARFSTMEKDFSDVDSMVARYNEDAYDWWGMYGIFAPMLQSIAFKLLGQPSSSSCSERNWSTYSFINSVRRNKLMPQRADDLVYIHSNLRLLSRRDPEYSKGETKLWDIAGDSFDSFEDVGMLEVAHLSLDEPDLEAVVFTDDGSGNEANDGGAEDEEDVMEV